jgi:hypothetical protein
MTCVMRDLAFRASFAVGWPDAPGRNRVKLIRYRGPIRFRAHTVPDVARKRPRGLPHSINAINAFRSREISDFHPLSRVFALIGRPPAVRRLPRRTSACDEPRPLSLYRCVIARCGFGGHAFDSVRERDVPAGISRLLRCAPTIAVSVGAIRKYRIETVPCRETSITNACYLCNTLRKTGGDGSLEVVP